MDYSLINNSSSTNGIDWKNQSSAFFGQLLIDFWKILGTFTEKIRQVS